MGQGMEEQAAEVLSQRYNIVAMALFIVSRFISTYLMKFFNPGKMLRTFAVMAAILTLGVILFRNIWGLYCLVAVSACMSLMFPTIYGIALKGMGEDAKFGAAGLIMAILGGSLLPPLQARIIDMGIIGTNFPAINASFILPMISFLVVAWYGRKAYRRSIAVHHG
jgi:FHS family L-fucose permease-like MFS transporter